MTAPAVTALADPEVLRGRLVVVAEDIARQIETFRAEHTRLAESTEPWRANFAPEQMTDQHGRPILLDAYSRLASALAAIADLNSAQPPTGVQVTVHNPAALTEAEVVDRYRMAAAFDDEQRRAAESAREALSAIRQSLAQHGYVTGSDIAQAVVRVLHTARQYREAFSHASQIQSHYRDALADIVKVHDGRILLSESLNAARLKAREALDNPPEWDGVLR